MHQSAAILAEIITELALIAVHQELGGPEKVGVVILFLGIVAQCVHLVGRGGQQKNPGLVLSV